MSARIFQRPKNAMQSGRAGTEEWLLSFESSAKRRADPLTGWAGGTDTQSQVILTFNTLEAAKAYAQREGIDYHLVPSAGRTLKIQSYADNFR